MLVASSRVPSGFRGFSKSAWRLTADTVAEAAGMALVVAAMLAGAGCQSSSADQQLERVTIWRPVGIWSGSGDGLTGSFQGATGSYRVTWETRKPNGSKRSGTFRLTLNSAISGRSLAPVVEHEGAGRDVAYVSADPRFFYLAIESADVDWSFTVDEHFTAMAPRGSINRDATPGPPKLFPVHSKTSG